MMKLVAKQLPKTTKSNQTFQICQTHATPMLQKLAFFAVRTTGKRPIGCFACHVVFVPCWGLDWKTTGKSVISRYKVAFYDHLSRFFWSKTPKGKRCNLFSPSSLPAMCGQHRSPTKDQLVSWKIHPNSTKPLIGRLATKSKGVSLILAPVIFASQHERVESWSSKVYQCIKFLFSGKKRPTSSNKTKGSEKEALAPWSFFCVFQAIFSAPNLRKVSATSGSNCRGIAGSTSCRSCCKKSIRDWRWSCPFDHFLDQNRGKATKKNVWSKRNRLPKNVKEEKADFGVGRRGRPRVSRYFFQRCFDSWMFSFFA